MPYLPCHQVVGIQRIDQSDHAKRLALLYTNERKQPDHTAIMGCNSIPQCCVTAEWHLQSRPESTEAEVLAARTIVASSSYIDLPAS